MRNNKIRFVSPTSLAPLEIDLKNKNLFSPETKEDFPVLRNIPRFVPLDNYASSFGLQWNAFRKTQLDSYTGLSISRDRLTRIAGGSLNIFKGKNVLEAGCGAGRFTEIMLSEGANVWAVDLSVAVDANYENCHHYSGYSVCQANILSLPFQPSKFDIVVCIGVIQHTPSPEKTIQKLCEYLQPGGLLLIDHYAPGYPITPSRIFLRKLLLQKPAIFSYYFVWIFAMILWPLHIFMYMLRKNRGLQKIRNFFLKLSPIVDYQEAYPELSKRLLFEWAVLDTHDTLTDYYKHLRSADDIENILSLCGMSNIQIAYAGNGVETSALKTSIDSEHFTNNQI